MSSLSIPRPKKMSDGQFIGDLTKLLERRKIKCGDPSSLESFGPELTSNNILRSDLFTLCTAISHMADEDLSGEQLLVLVARAVGGVGVCRGEGAVEIPESMRSVFLTGFEAWGKRGSELNEPLPWPPPRPQLARSEPAPAVDDSAAASAPSAPKPHGLHSIQEALDIAKKRSPTSLQPQRSAPGTNIEGLTISELKTLLEDIEHRMSRIQPHLSQLNSIVDSAAADLRRQKKASESEDVIPFRATAEESASKPAERRPNSLAGSLAAFAASEATGARRSPVADVNEDAFLARHPYLKPSRRKVPDFPIDILPATEIDAPPVVAPAAALSVTQGDLSGVPDAAAPLMVPVSTQPGPLAPAAAGIEAAAPAHVVAPQAAPILLPNSLESASGDAPVIGLNPIGAALLYIVDGLRANPRLVFALAGVLLLIPLGFTGLVIYNYSHPNIAIRYHAPTPPAMTAPELPADALAGVTAADPGVATHVAPRPQASPATSGTRLAPGPQPAIAHSGTGRDATPQARPSKPQSQAYVWPPPPDRAEETPAPPRPLVAAATSTLPSSSAPRPTQLTGPPASAIYVPSSTMIKYAVTAPRPIYPVDQVKGLDGTVVLQITISRQGDVSSARAISGPIEFRSAAVQAVRTWHFRPYLFNGSPADVETMLEVPFKPQ